MSTRGVVVGVGLCGSLGVRDDFRLGGGFAGVAKRNELSGRTELARTTSASLHFRAPSGGAGSGGEVVSFGRCGRCPAGRTQSFRYEE